MDELRDRVRDFIRRLVPRGVINYIPGPKLIAGGILAVLAQVFGIGGDQVVNLPVVGEISVAALALIAGTYFWPESNDPEIEGALANDLDLDELVPPDSGEPMPQPGDFHKDVGVPPEESA